MDSQLVALLIDTCTVGYPGASTFDAYGPSPATDNAVFDCRVTKRLDIVTDLRGEKKSTNYLIRFNGDAALLALLEAHALAMTFTAPGFADEKVAAWSASYDEDGTLWSIRVWV